MIENLNLINNEELIDEGMFLEENEFEIKLDVENVKDITIDKTLFTNGVDSVSYFCGQFVALVNSGVDKASAIELVMQLQNSVSALGQQEMINNTQIEVSKNQQLMAMQSQI